MEFIVDSLNQNRNGKMKIFNILTLSLFFFSLSSSRLLFAEPGGQPREFFKQDYIQTPSIKNSTSHKLPGVEVNRKDSHKTLHKSSKTKPVIKPTSKVSGSIETTNETRIIKVHGIGMLLNIKDRKHYQQFARKLLQFSDRYNILISRVYLVGNIEPYKDDLLTKEMMLRGGRPAAGMVIPKKYKVSKSPSWILDTDEGEYVLDGALELNKFFTAKGEFIDQEAFIEHDSELVPLENKK